MMHENISYMSINEQWLKSVFSAVSNLIMGMWIGARPGRIMPEILPIMLFYYSQKLHLLFLYILSIIPKNNPVTAC